MIVIKPDERIIIEVRPHWLAILRNFIISGLLVLLPFIIITVLYQLSFPLDQLGLAPLAVFLTGAWILVVWIFFYIAWTDYYLDVLILTDQRLIDIEQKGLFAREVSELRIENIQDVTVEVSGFLETLLDFGNVRIQTAASDQEFLVRTIPHPSKVKDIILSRYDTLNK